MKLNWGKILNGVGSLASAWGSYEVGKEQAKIEKEKLSYEKSKDTEVAKKTEMAQQNLDGALDNVYGVKKKKKTSPNTLSDAFSTPTVV
jgi:hypothetical protein